MLEKEKQNWQFVHISLSCYIVHNVWCRFPYSPCGLCYIYQRKRSNVKVNVMSMFWRNTATGTLVKTAAGSSELQNLLVHTLDQFVFLYFCCCYITILWAYTITSKILLKSPISRICGSTDVWVLGSSEWNHKESTVCELFAVLYESILNAFYYYQLNTLTTLTDCSTFSLTAVTKVNMITCCLALMEKTNGFVFQICLFIDRLEPSTHRRKNETMLE